MAVCLWCQAEILYANLPCRACGKRQADHPSLAKSGYSSAAPSVPPPDLDVAVKVPSLLPPAPAPRVAPVSARPVAVPRAPAKPAARTAPGPAEMPGVGGAMFDADDILAPDGAPVSLELDMPVRSAPPPARSLAPAPVANAPAAARSPARPVLGPPGREPSPEEVEASAFAGYGPPPAAWWQAPLYAYRVKTRQAELRRVLLERKAEAKKARASEEDALVSFGERARPVAAKQSAYMKALEAIDRAEKALRHEDGAAAKEMDAQQGRLADVDRRIAALEQDLALAKAEEVRVEEEQREIEATRQRAEAKMKRADIEIRNVKRAGGPGSG